MENISFSNETLLVKKMPNIFISVGLFILILRANLFEYFFTSFLSGKIDKKIHNLETDKW